MIGHTLSAAGAVEAVFTLLTLEHQRLPPTINYEIPDPAIPLDVVPNVARDGKVRHALSNSCGVCKACRDGRDNLCENVGGVMGFHVDGFARDLLNLPARLVIPVPPGVSHRDAACAPIAFGTV